MGTYKGRIGMTHKIETIMFFAPFLYIVPVALGYLSLLTDNDLLGKWSIGILSVLALINIGAIALVAVLKKKEKEK